jgi:hypothetical protein
MPLCQSIKIDAESEVMIMPRTRAQLEQDAAEIEAWLDQVDPDDPTVTVDLRAIGHAFVATVSAENAVRDAVIAARENGWGWNEIAHILGMSRQSAQQRYDVFGGGNKNP